jgi:hypothetical protein
MSESELNEMSNFMLALHTILIPALHSTHNGMIDALAGPGGLLTISPPSVSTKTSSTVDSAVNTVSIM